MVFQVTTFLQASRLYSGELRTLSPQPIYVSNPSEPQNFYLFALKNCSGSTGYFSSSLALKESEFKCNKKIIFY